MQATASDFFHISSATALKTTNKPDKRMFCVFFVHICPSSLDPSPYFSDSNACVLFQHATKYKGEMK